MALWPQETAWDARKRKARCPSPERRFETEIGALSDGR